MAKTEEEIAKRIIRLAARVSKYGGTKDRGELAELLEVHGRIRYEQPNGKAYLSEILNSRRHHIAGRERALDWLAGKK